MSSRRKQRTIRRKLLTTIAGITIITCLLLGAATSLLVHRVSMKQTTEELTALTELTAHDISTGFGFGKEWPVRNALSGLFGIEGVRFAKVSLADGDTFVSMGDTVPRWVDTSTAWSTRIEEGSELLVASTPIHDKSNQVIGTLSLGYRPDKSRNLLSANLTWLIAITVALAFVSVLVGISLAKRLTKPLLGLTDAARRLAAGTMDKPVPVESDDEVGELARTFNEMSAKLARSRQEVLEANQRLEEKVAERTLELEQANNSLQQQNEQARDASESKSSFLASVSHELRTPLNGILALSELLKDGVAGELTEEQHSHADMIHRSGTNLLRLINDVLDLSKIEAGKLEIHPVECDLLGDLQRTLGGMTSLAQAKKLDLRTNIDNGPHVIADSSRVCQVLVNLVGNAIKFTNRGYVEVCAGIGRETKQLTIDVSDTGIGMPPESLEMIFQEFRQIDEPSSSKLGGTGLGLAISRRLAEMMGGTLEVESTLGQGSKFTLSIPLEVCPERAEGPGQSERAA